MLDRIIDWVKSLLHEETSEEQDKRIHETIQSWKDKVDKDELERVDAYFELCRYELATFRLLVGQDEANARHLALWDRLFPQIKNKDNALKAWNKWHEAHLFLSGIYRFDVTYPPNDQRFGQIKEHVDLRPAKWLKDLADEEKIIKALQMEYNAKQYKV